MLRSRSLLLPLSIFTVVALHASDASSQTRVRGGIGGSIGYTQAGVPVAQGEPQNYGFAPGVGFYFNVGAQFSDRTGLYLHGTVVTALLAYAGGADLMIDWALANHRVTLGTGIGTRGVFTLFQASSYRPSPITEISGPYSSWIVGVPLTLAYLLPGRDLPTERRGLRIGLETLTGVNLSFQGYHPSLGLQVALTAGYEWY